MWMGGRNHCSEFLPGGQDGNGLNRHKETQFSRSMSGDIIEGPLVLLVPHLLSKTAR